MNRAIVVADAERGSEWDPEPRAHGTRQVLAVSAPVENPGPRGSGALGHLRKVKYLRAEAGVVRREGLFRRLSGTGDGGTVLLCASAGSGKSVLVGSWLEAEGLANRVAWVSVERDEWDGHRFVASVTDALAGLDGSLERVAPAPDVRGDAAFDQLLSGLLDLEERIVLVIDDLHELRSIQALGWLERLLALRSSRVLVVLLSREDPGLGLHRLRLVGELTELRGADLLFSLPETRQLLALAGVRLSQNAVARLHERSEGWVAGLRLAAISLAQHPEPERFVAEFSGGERTVAGYLLAEVLDRQTEEVRELLLRTSVVGRVCGSLADRLTGGSGCARVLQELESANAFVTSLDIERSWFRYHGLFGDLLQLELRRVAPASIGSLHRAAARWHEQHGNIVEAIRHAQAGNDWELAGRLLIDHHTSLFLDGRIASVRELSCAFPSAAPSKDPELALVFAAMRASDGVLAEAAGLIDLARSLADKVPTERRPRFDAQLAGTVLSLARRRGDFDGAVRAMASVQDGLENQPADEHVLVDELRATSLQNMGAAELWASCFDDAHRHLAQALALARRIGRPYLEISCLGYLAIAGPASGSSAADALTFAEEAVAIAQERGWIDDPAIAPASAAGAIALICVGRFDEVEEWLARAETALLPEADPGTELIVQYARGLLHQADGRLEDALGAFRAAQHVQALLSTEHAVTTMVNARLLQTRVRTGDVAAVRSALADLGPDQRGNAWMRLTAALAELAEGRPQHALEVLAPAIENSAPGLHHSLFLTEALVVDAAARDQLRDRRAAEASLEWALELAEPEGMILPFLLAPVRDLLESYPPHRTAHATLLRAINDVLAGSSATRPGNITPLFGELTAAELRIVRYLPSNLTAPEIAGELYLSAHTVRTHIRHIYTKLDAHDRNQAVARARELGLLARSR